MGITTFIAEEIELLDLHFTISVGIHFAISTLVFACVSMLSVLSDFRKMDNFYFLVKGVFKESENIPWYKNYLYQMVFVALFIFLVLFWIW